MFTKGQTVTIKKRGASANLKQFAGETLEVVRGGVGNVKLFSYSSGNQVKVPATELATSILKN